MAFTRMFVFVLCVLLLLLSASIEALPTPPEQHYTKRYGYHNTYRREVDRARRIARGSKEAAQMARLIKRNRNAEKIRQQKRRFRSAPNNSHRVRSSI